MDSRNISENARVRLAGGLRRIQRRRFRRGRHCGVHSKSGGASSNAILSRGVRSDAQEARFCERRINLRLTNSVVPAGDSIYCESVYPALKRWAISGDGASTERGAWKAFSPKPRGPEGRAMLISAPQAHYF